MAEKTQVKQKGIKIGNQYVHEAKPPPVPRARKPKSGAKYFLAEARKALERRNRFRIIEELDCVKVDVTPNLMEIAEESHPFHIFLEQLPVDPLQERSSATSVISKATNMTGGPRFKLVSLDELCKEIGSLRFRFDQHETEGVDSLFGKVASFTKHELPYIKVTLKFSQTFVLYEQRSITVDRNTYEGQLVEEDNQLYDYLTIGKGKNRRLSEAETQTYEAFRHSQAAQTTLKTYKEEEAFASFYEVYDTYELVNAIRKHELDSDSEEEIEYVKVKSYDEQTADIVQLPTFRLRSMIMKRLLASNEYEAGMRRFRNFEMPERLLDKIDYKYNLNQLFMLPHQNLENVRRAVADMSFNYANGDIIAVAYGIYSYTSMHVPDDGYVCIWSIKNPGDPERTYQYKVPVVSLEFSPYEPTLLAIGLYDGNVEVRDITLINDVPVAISTRATSPGCEPVTAIKWIENSEGDMAGIDPVLTVSQDGSVTRYRIVKSPYLAGYPQMLLQRVEGNPEGIVVKLQDDLELQANRNPQGLNITLHPTQSDIYYVLTDEGCIHRCSVNYTHQYLEVLRTHAGSVHCMDFSPWSSKVFLTCGNDWCVRIWIEGVFKPVVTLQNRMIPWHCAYFSRTHSTIIIAVCRTMVDIWDIRRSTLQPMSSTNLSASFNTMARISNCGRSIAVGTERGNVEICALDDLPLQPHFQYDELEKALLLANKNNPDMLMELKGLGYIGYPDGAFMRPK